MRRRPRFALVSATGLIILALAGLGGCNRAKPDLAPEAEPPSAQTPSEQTQSLQAETTYRLAKPLDGNLVLVPGETFAVTVDNCAGDTQLAREHVESLIIASSLSLLVGTEDTALRDQRPAMEEMVIEAYGLTDDDQVFEGSIQLSVPPNSQVEYLLRWDEEHDANLVEVVSEEQVLAGVPVEVVRSATLVRVTAVPKPCPATEVSVPLVGAESKSPSLPPPGSEEAMELVKDYVGAVSQGNLEGAYRFFHQAYQERTPFEAYQRGYANVVEHEIHSIDVMQVSKYLERAEVVVTLGMKEQGQIEYSDWMMVVDVSVDRGRPPYQRSISYVIMRRLGLE